MKHMLLITLLFISNLALKASNNDTDTAVARYTQVWGLLKYYHPAVSNGKLDWDNIFVKNISGLLATKNTSQFLDSCFLQYNVDADLKKKSLNIDSLIKAIHLEWIYDNKTISTKLKHQLITLLVLDSKYRGGYYARKSIFDLPNFKNERIYSNLKQKSVEYRLLDLARYWNIVNYFFPYKELTDVNWNDIILNFPHRFINIETEHQLIMLELINSINDGHAGLFSNEIYSFFGKKWFPYSVRVINNEVVINSFRDEKFGVENKLQIGDIITKIDGSSINKIIAEKIKYCKGSNLNFKNIELSSFLMMGQRDSSLVSYIRNEHKEEKWIKRYSYVLFKDDVYKVNSEKFYCVKKNILYSKFYEISYKSFKKQICKLNEKSALILDMRGYPTSQAPKKIIEKILLDSSKIFSVFEGVNFKQPGMFRKLKPVKIYKKGKKTFDGLVVVLINENSISRAEYVCMALQKLPNVIFVGTPTAGADGNIVQIKLVNGLKTQFSGLKVLSPNGSQTQRKGIQPDVEINLTIDDLIKSRDPQLEKAINIAMSFQENKM